MMADDWSLSSWRSKPIKQQPPYPEESKEVLKDVISQISQMPPIVHHGEVDRLKADIAAAGRGEKLILHGGDCAERFQDCTSTMIENKLRILLQMSLVFTWQAHIPVVRILRGAGQFAKPRSSNYETVDGKQVPSFRGDNVNGFDISERTPDPNRLMRAFFHSSTTCNYIRALLGGGFASLQYPHAWNLDFIRREDVRGDYNSILAELDHGLGFLRAARVLDTTPGVNTVDINISHEGLVLDYEEALTKKVGTEYYNLGSHFLWIGDRTRQLDGAHIEYFRGIANPIGIKCGPTLGGDELSELLLRLNPANEEGKITLITRYGSDKIAQKLPEHIEAVKRSGAKVTWVSDAVHGNTYTTDNGFKTRNVSNILAEIQQSCEIHQASGTVFGGVHLEMTGENVTECVGGSSELQHEELSQDYVTFCDPRLNYTQSLDIAFQMSNFLRERQQLSRSDANKKRKLVN